MKFFMGFQNIKKLLKLDKQNSSYWHFKFVSIIIMIMYINTEFGGIYFLLNIIKSDFALIKFFFLNETLIAHKPHPHTWYPNAWGELSTMIVLERSLPNIPSSLMNSPPTQTQCSLNSLCLISCRQGSKRLSNLSAYSLVEAVKSITCSVFIDMMIFTTYTAKWLNERIWSELSIF